MASTWIGGSTDAFDLAANWSPASVPLDGVTLLFNDLAQQGLFTNIDAITLAAKDFDVIVSPGFKYAIGTSLLPFEPAQGFGVIVYSGSGTTPSFFSADGSQVIERAIVNTAVQKDDVVTFQGDGSIDQLIIRSGKAALASTTVTSGGRIEVTGSQSGAPAELRIPTGITLTSVDIGVRGGMIDCSSDCANVDITGGEFILNGGADMVALLMMGGVCHWDAFDVSSPSTITEAEILGGTFRIREDRAGRTLTNCNYYSGGTVDFRIGGFSVVMTNALRNLGGTFITPVGSSTTLGI